MKNETDICGFDRYVLESTGDVTDRSREIEEKLRLYGVCVLGAGDFYVSGVVMPDRTTIMGQGNATRVLLLPEVTDGAAIRIGSFCTVKSMCIAGAETEQEIPDGIGTRHGLLFLGTATTKDWANQTRNSVIEGCYIHSFSGGGLKCFDTGYHIRSAFTASNCHIVRCGAGIYIPHFSEYHEFTNMHCCENYCGCVNNGGNNVFLNCGFNGNKIGFLIDNGDGKACNNSHGSAVGCTFNHSDNNEGIGIKIVGANSGYVFSGGQMFFSKIILENSERIQFTGMNFGRKEEIRISGGSTMMTSCFFGSPHKVELSDGAVFRHRDCIDATGEDCLIF